LNKAMNLNLPILDALGDSRNILIAGAGGGFDVFSGLPLYFTLRQMGKTVHLANYSFTEFDMVRAVSQPQVLIDSLLLGAQGPIQINLPYYPEGYLSRWFKEVRHENVTVWMFGRTGVVPLIQAYTQLVKHLNIDAIVLVDGGVDSIMRGDEVGSGTLVEDSISLAALDQINVPVKLLACVGFGTEVEEAVCHYNALENMAGLAKAGGFLGGCALTPQMEAFRLFEAACRYVWQQPGHHRSHISTRIIPAVNGEFGNHHMYESDRTPVFISPLMSLYWFFDARTVIARSLLIPRIGSTLTTRQVVMICATLKQEVKLRFHQAIPY
jgi:hypothetical protein